MKLFPRQSLLCFALLSVSTLAQAQPVLHGTAAEAQAVREMTARLRAALNSGNTNVCRLEGDNMARYRQADAEQLLIEQELAAVQARLRQTSAEYDLLNQLRDAHARQAVTEAYALIRQIGVKLAEDAVTDLSVTLVTLPVGGAGKVITEMGKQGADFLGNFKDAHSVVNKGKALQSLDAYVRYADSLLGSLGPAVKALQSQRQLLSTCLSEYQGAVQAAQQGVTPGNVGRWVLVQVNDLRHEDAWAAANKHISYNYFPSYARGSYSVRTLFEGKTDENSQPPTYHGESWGAQATWTLPPGVMAGNQKVELKATLQAVEFNTSFFNTSGYTAAWVGQTRVTTADGKVSSLELKDAGQKQATFVVNLGTGSAGQRKTLEFSFLAANRLGTQYVYEWSAVKQPISAVENVGNAAQVTAPPLRPSVTASPWTGTWTTSEGRMVLRQDGQKVTGTYDFKGGQISGTLSGNVLKGEWVQTNARGPFTFTLSGDGKSFKGSWSYSTSPDRVGGTWTGTKQ